MSGIRDIRMLLLGCGWQWAQLQMEKLGTCKKDELAQELGGTEVEWLWILLQGQVENGHSTNSRMKELPGYKNAEAVNDKKPHYDWLIEMKDGHWVSTVHSHSSRCWGSEYIKHTKSLLSLILHSRCRRDREWSYNIPGGVKPQKKIKAGQGEQCYFKEGN